MHVRYAACICKLTEVKKVKNDQHAHAVANALEMTKFALVLKCTIIVLGKTCMQAVIYIGSDNISRS